MGTNYFIIGSFPAGDERPYHVGDAVPGNVPGSILRLVPVPNFEGGPTDRWLPSLSLEKPLSRCLPAILGSVLVRGNRNNLLAILSSPLPNLVCEIFTCSFLSLKTSLISFSSLVFRALLCLPAPCTSRGFPAHSLLAAGPQAGNQGLGGVM